MEVAREATSQNQSTYFLDGKKTNFKELGVLLREKGIDLDHNRFLILQGEVESIAMMKPKAQNENDDGLLEYLEDIIGCVPAASAVECGRLWDNEGSSQAHATTLLTLLPHHTCPLL